MKRQEGLAILLVGALLSGVVTAGAADAGSAGDPLISLDWLKSTFIPNLVSEAENKVDDATDTLNQLQGTAGVDLRVKRGDVLWLESGAGLTPLAGELEAAAATGAIVDTTSGQELSTVGEKITTDHRYLAAESTRAAFSVISDTAVVRLTGSYQLSPSQETDYNALAESLKTMGLFQGSDQPYGSGYELEGEPTRIQGLIMFLRLMGEEQYALAYPGSGITFADVPDWALPYVAYAYDKGYTKGQAVDSQWRVVFGTEGTLASRDYMTFLMRALGYTEGTDFQWLTAVTDAQDLGVLTKGEVSLLTDKPFLRAQVVYLSYFSLSDKLAGEDKTLLDRLISNGVVTSSAAASAMTGLDGQRL